MKAVWNKTILAESEDTVIIEGNHYFPPKSINSEYFENSETKTHCAWKGDAHYLNIKANDAELNDAAWKYPEPSEKAKNIKDHVAFWRGVEIIE